MMNSGGGRQNFAGIMVKPCPDLPENRFRRAFRRVSMEIA